MIPREGVERPVRYGDLRLDDFVIPREGVERKIVGWNERPRDELL